MKDPGLEVARVPVRGYPWAIGIGVFHRGRHQSFKKSVEHMMLRGACRELWIESRWLSPIAHQQPSLGACEVDALRSRGPILVKPGQSRDEAAKKNGACDPG